MTQARGGALLLLLLVMFVGPAVVVAQVDSNVAGCAGGTGVAPSPLERSIQRLAEISGGTVGVAALHLETGQRVAMNGDLKFPMASVYKLPIAVQLMHRVERGEVRLSGTLALTARDYRGGHSPLADLARDKPITISIERLLELMLGESDNTASDALLKVAGGPAAVRHRLRELNVTNIDVSRFEVELLAEYYGLLEMPPESAWSLKLFNELYGRTTPEQQQSSQERYATDLRDTSTPNAMVDLLVRLHRRQLLTPAATQRLLQIMTDTATGGARLKGLLPPGTSVAHKTGSMGGRATNDVGIITLPDNTGHVAIAIFVKSSSKAGPERERAIAEIARTLYDFFLLQQSGK